MSLKLVGVLGYIDPTRPTLCATKGNFHSPVGSACTSLGLLGEIIHLVKIAN
jgi:hypothetical protein